ncbi:MAG TPA: tRNA pseudouridine(38-40) synthase TruA [Bryobacteraceae bacterium]|nr:tRNA pseudouridine(38-40) synthase TruA [Bryobacteraceae bacterium]
MPRRIRIIVAYDGTDFHGWQVQPGLPTIQSVLEEIMEGIEGRAVRVEGSGRTDAGVHALAQVAAFTIENPIPGLNLRRAMNRLLPASVRILDAEEVRPDFHPRFDAIAKTYRYTIFRDEVCPPMDWRYVYHHPYPLDEDAMFRAASVYAGEHDFKAFAAADHRSEPVSTVRTIFSSAMERRGSAIVYTVRGSGFLKHMVRNIVGTILEAGRGNIGAETLPKRSGRTAPAKGLTLVSVEYPEGSALPLRY